MRVSEGLPAIEEASEAHLLHSIEIPMFQRPDRHPLSSVPTHLRASTRHMATDRLIGLETRSHMYELQ